MFQISPYVEYNGFAHSMSLVALCNTGFPIRHRYWERLLQYQKTDGSFPLGMGMYRINDTDKDLAGSDLDRQKCIGI